MDTPEPTRRRLNPETPQPKNVSRIRMPPVNKPEWDIVAKDDGLFSFKDLNLDEINKILDKVSDENNSENNS
jgi:hypothetical protein